MRLGIKAALCRPWVMKSEGQLSRKQTFNILRLTSASGTNQSFMWYSWTSVNGHEEILANNGQQFPPDVNVISPAKLTSK